MLFSLKRYEGEQPQFVHRHVLKRILEGDGVRVSRGLGVERLRGRRLETGHSDDTGHGGDEVVLGLSDGSEVVADLVIGASPGHH